MKQVKNKIMIFGTFDCLHKGHLHFIQESQKLGEELKIIIARDCNVEKIKNKKPLQNQIKRLKSVQNAFPSAKVRLGEKHNFYQSIENFQPDTIALGYDQKADLTFLKKQFPKIQIKRISAFKPHKYKSSLINQNL